MTEVDSWHHLLQVIYMMEVEDLRQGPIDDTVLVLQQGHRSRAVWLANVSDNS